MLASLDATFGNWLIKASSFDDQILIIGYNIATVDYFFKMFYDEEIAREFMEKLNDSNFKVGDR